MTFKHSPPGLVERWLATGVLVVLLLSGIGPAEQTFGDGVRIVYPYGAMVWTALTQTG